MIPRWLREFYGGMPATFFSARSVDDCVGRLRRRVRGSLLTSLDRDCIAGHVQRDSVRLQHLRPFVYNGFKPVFVGRFVDDKGGAILSGRFIPMLIPRIFMAMWLGFVAFWTLLVTALAILFQFAPTADETDPRMVWMLPPAGLALGMVGLGFLWLASRISHSDIDYLTRTIDESLATDDEKAPALHLHDVD